MEIRNIRLGIVIKSDTCIQGDPTSLYLIVKNAVDNALRYTHPNGEVELGFRIDGDSSIIEVTDSGPGIPEAKRAAVFEPFFRIGQSGAEGCGLGLAIAKDAAMKLGGTISLHDRAGRMGLVFQYRQSRG